MPRIPVISNTTATAWPVNPTEARALLASQLASPVRFVEVVEALYAAGARTFLEVGPKSTLTSMVKATLGSRPFLVTAIDAQSRRGGVGDFAFALAQVAAEGHAVRWSEWNKFAPPPRWKAKAPRTPKMVVPLTGANYRTPFAPIPPRQPKPATTVVTVAPTTQVSNTSDLAAALGAYEAARKPRTSRVQAASRFNARLFHLPDLAGTAAFTAAGLADLVTPGGSASRFDWLYGYTAP
jgi:acyl transferase domain-containing protein